MTIRTTDRQWEYAAAFTRVAMDTSIAGVIVVRIRLRVLAGSVGVGCLDVSERAFLDEQSVDRGDVASDIYLLASTAEETGTLILRNASAEGPSEAQLLDIACFEMDVSAASDEPRVPPLSEPYVVHRWSRFYGNQNFTIAERLRARAFDALAGTGLMTWSDGMSFRVVEGDQLSRALFVSGTYEPNTLRVLRALLRDGDVFIDVGANAGVVSMAASRWVETGRIFSIEPSTREFERLVDNVTRNQLTNVTPVHLAIGARAGTLQLHIAGNAHGGLNTVGGRFPYDGVELLRTESVPALSLDEFVRDHNIDKLAVVKLDIEGSEGQALSGSRHVLDTLRPALVLEVFSRSLEAQGWTRAQLAELLLAAKYAMFSIDDETGRLIAELDLEDLDERNVVAVPDALRSKLAIDQVL
jgi:FkbM family methyltransferase